MLFTGWLSYFIRNHVVMNRSQLVYNFISKTDNRCYNHDTSYYYMTVMF